MTSIDEAREILGKEFDGIDDTSISNIIKLFESISYIAIEVHSLSS